MKTNKELQKEKKQCHEPDDDDCYKEKRCMEEPCQDKIVDRHDLKNGITFLEMVRKYHDPIYDPKEYTVKSIVELIKDLDCTQGHLIEFDAKDKGDNSDIKLLAITSPFRGRYSIAFFKGLIRKYALADNDTFEFYKAKDCNDDVTMAMKVKVQATDVYFGDLVGLYP